MTTDTTTEFETLYKAAVGSAELSTVSRGSANSLIERLMESRNDPTALDLTRRIQEAAGQGDTDAIFRLTDELRHAKAAENERSAKLTKLAEEFTFMDLLRAYPKDFRDLTYELGLLVLQKTQEGLATYKKPARQRSGKEPKGTVYVISHNGESIEAMKNIGAARLPGAEVEFFEFLGFDISSDGRLLDPPTFVNINGETVPANSKKAVIEDLLAGNKFWMDRGYRIKTKDAQTTA
jgi:hypothetical protein